MNLVLRAQTQHKLLLTAAHRCGSKRNQICFTSNQKTRWVLRSGWQFLIFSSCFMSTTGRQKKQIRLAMAPLGALKHKVQQYYIIYFESVVKLKNILLFFKLYHTQIYLEIKHAKECVQMCVHILFLNFFQVWPLVWLKRILNVATHNVFITHNVIMWPGPALQYDWLPQVPGATPFDWLSAQSGAGMIHMTDE